MSKFIQILDFSFKVLTSGGEKWKFHYFLASSDLWFLHKQSSRQYSSVEASRACVHEVVSSNPGGAYFFFFNIFFYYSLMHLVYPILFKQICPTFFQLFFNSFQFFQFFFQLVPNMFPTCSQFFPNFFPTFLPTFFDFSKSTCFQLCINFFQLFNRLF